MKKLLSLALSLLLIALMLPSGIFAASADAFTLNDAVYSGDVKVDVPDSWWNDGVSYPHIIQLHSGDAVNNNALLATFSEHSRGVKDENGVPYDVGYPIYRSNDLGQTWEFITRVTDPVNDSTQRAEWMPTFYELPEDFGDMKKGTILLAGVSHDDDQVKNTFIQLYSSTDGGYSWDFVSTIAKGGAVKEKNGVYEPELELINGELVCYYSDETNANHAQRIVYRTSKDGYRWGDAFVVVAVADKEERPGMSVVTKTANGYFMAYEMVGSQKTAIYYRTSVDGLNWGSKTQMGTKLTTAEGKTLFGAPYVEWTPYGGEHGTIFVNASKGHPEDGNIYFVSQDNGLTWTTVKQPIQVEGAYYANYSCGMDFSADGKIMFALNLPTQSKVEVKTEDTTTYEYNLYVKSATVELEAGAAALTENQYGATSAESLVEYAAGYTEENISWSEDFTTSTTSPMTMHSGHEGINQVVDGRWQIGHNAVHDNFSLKGLLNNREITDFAISFELYIASDYGVRKYIFHDNTGWAGNYDSYIEFTGSAAGEHSVKLVNGGNAVTWDSKLPKGHYYNVVLISNGWTADLYIWEKGTTAPALPILTAYSDYDKSGDFHLDTYDANDFVDNIRIYENTDVLTDEEISDIVGTKVGEENLKYENYFNGEKDILPMKNAAINSVSGGKWAVATNTGSSANVTTGFTGNNNLRDFVMAFEYTKVTGSGARNFMFHKAAAGNANEAWDSMLQIRWDGSVKLYSEGDDGVTASTDAHFISNNVTYNVVVKAVGVVIEAYVWAKGSEAPAQPTVSVTANNSTKGDVYFDFYDVNNDIVDAIKVYELGIDTALISEVAGVKDEQIIYKNDFSFGDAPITMKETRVNTVADGRWCLGGNQTNHYSTTGLTGNTKIKNFVLSFEISRGGKWGTRTIQFHRTAGSATQDNYSFVRINYDGTLSVSNGGTKNATAADFIKEGKTYSVIVKAVGDTISAYAWEKGTAAPNAPTVSASNTIIAMGDMYFDFFDVAGDYLDNIVVYELPISADEIATVTGEEISDDSLIYDNYLNEAGFVPVRHFPDYTATSEIADKQWHITKELASREGLVGYDLYDFVASFEFKAGIKWGNRRFSFHTNTGWPDQQDSWLDFSFVSGNENQYLVPKLYHGDQTATTDMVINVNKYYNVVIKSVGYTASVYIWEKGTAAPTAPTLTATSETASLMGDLHLYTYEANDYIDNICVYSVGEEMTLLCSMPMYNRTEFVSGIVAEFGYAPMEGMQVIEQGIIANCGGEIKTIKVANDTNFISAVITGDLAGKSVTAQAYLKFKLPNGVQYELYSYTEKADYAVKQYSKATYGDATGDGAVNVLDLIRMKKAISGLTDEIATNNVEYDGIEGLEGNDLAMQKKVLLMGVEKLIPTDVNYINF